jgi:hypothetical protein
MTTRNRMTWNQPRLPVEARKKASEHPAYPDEGITHPAGYEDPTQPAAYENGDTSSWAEDVHPGPYRTSPAPANPMDDGGYRHPAAQPGAPAKNASMTRAAAEAKAAKCIRIAQALLGKNATVEMVEDQAFDFMDLSDSRLASTIRRVEAATEDEEVLLRKMLATDDEDADDAEGDEDEAETASKKATDQRFAQVLSAIEQLSARVATLSKGADDDGDEDDKEEDDDSAEEEVSDKAASFDEEETMLANMLAEASCEAPAMAEVTMADDGDFGLNDFDADPMSFGDGEYTDIDDATLDSLYADDPILRLAKKAEDGDEDEEVEEEVVEKTASRRTASLRPQPKKPSTGVKTLGAVRTASRVSDHNELSALWESAPDVSNVFGK